MKTTKLILALAGLVLGIVPGFAQQAANVQAYNLQQAVQFALQNQPAIKNAQLAIQTAKARVGEIKSMGLPQINAAVDFNTNLNIQRVFLPGAFFGTPEVDVVPAKFGTTFSNSAAITGSQLLFDGSYLIGLKAAKVYTDLAQKQLEQSEVDVMEQVAKAYYSVLVSRERIGLLNQNLIRLEKMLNDTKEINRQGFAEKIDVDRLQVSFNNLKVEKDKAERLFALSEDLLKFQMGMEQNQDIVLTDNLDNVVIDAQQIAIDNFNYGQRLEYSILETQRDLALLDLRNKKSGYYPKLYLNGRWGYNAASNDFSRITRFNGDSYFNFSGVGFSLQVPIFDGFRKKYQIEQANIAVQTANNGFKILQQNIDLQLNQSNTNLRNALQVVEAQKQSLELAQEIARVANIKFKEGVGSNLEVISAETELRQAQTNYYSAVYDAIIAKVELQRATGTLKK